MSKRYYPLPVSSSFYQREKRKIVSLTQGNCGVCMVAGRMQRPEYNGTTDTKESLGRCVRQWKINLYSSCRATCNFKGCNVKSVKHCGEPPREIKVYVQRKTGKTLAKRISARASRVARGGSFRARAFWPRLFLVFALSTRVTCARCINIH